MIRIDNPICHAEDDTLGRVKTAGSFVRYALSLDAKEGVVIGVLGSWGSGKTSFINLVREEFKQRGLPVLDFNPWLFSGSEQLVERFCAELSAELRLRDLTAVGKALENYGRALEGTFNTATGTVNVVVSLATSVTVTGLVAHIADASTAIISGFVVAGIAVLILKAVGQFLRHRQDGIASVRRKVEDALRKRNEPIFVVLDDVDRLSVSEIRDVFKLVRLTARFPNIVYIVACDRRQVEKALDEQGLSGHDYMEKILQLPFDLPETPNELLQEQLWAATDDALDGIEHPGPFDRQAWEEIYWEIVRPLVRNMRDIRRYATTIRLTLMDLAGQVALADVLGLEAVRMFLPGVFRLLPAVVNPLTVTSVGQENTRHIRTQSQKRTGISIEPDERFKEQVAKLIASANGHDMVVRAMIVRLFPVGQQYIPNAGTHPRVGSDDSRYGEEWAAKRLQERRVVHEHVLRVYLEHVAGDDLLVLDRAEQALDLMADSTALHQFLRSFDTNQFIGILNHLRTFSGRFNSGQVESGATVLLNLLAEMPKQSGGSIRDEPQLFVGLVIITLLGALEEPAAIEAAVRRILPAVGSLSSKVLLVDRVQRPRRDAQPLVSDAAATEFVKHVQQQIRSAPVDDLIEERDLLRVLGLAKSSIDPTRDPFDIPESPKLTLVLLRSADIQTLSILYGDVATLGARFERLIAEYEDMKPWIKSSSGISLDEAEQLLMLANNYQAELRKTTFPIPIPPNS